MAIDAAGLQHHYLTDDNIKFPRAENNFKGSSFIRSNSLLSSDISYFTTHEGYPQHSQLHSAHRHAAT